MIVHYFALGSEFRNWLLYYSLPVLSEVLPNPYFRHYSLLVLGISILSSECISRTHLQEAEVCLLKFYKEFSDLYGESVYYALQ